jgi:hypothetical protein
MTTGEIATRATIWIAMAGYAASLCFLLRGQHRLALVAYADGLIAFIAHVILAFGVFYDWSHSIAWSETARQTEAMTGTASGHGLYLNYLFGVVWLIDACYWWRRGEPLHRRSSAGAVVLHGFFLFMIVNGGIVFATGAVRWFSGALLMAIVVCAVSKRMSHRIHR